MIYAFDTETHPIKSGCLAPKMVCLSWATKYDSGLFLREEGLDWLQNKLVQEATLVGANTPYDLAVACAERPQLVELVFNAYRNGYVRCVQTRQKLLDIANGELKYRRGKDGPVKTKHHLATLVELWLGEHLEKEDTWRLKYGLLDDVPLSEWPEDAKNYARTDAVKTLEVYQAQETWIRQAFESEEGANDGVLPDEDNQNRAAWALHLMSMWGVRTDAAMVERFLRESQTAITKMQDALNGSGVIRPDGTQDKKEVQRRVVESLTRLSIAIPPTPKGSVKTAREVLQLSDDPVLLAIAESSKAIRDHGQWSEVLVAGTKGPSCARYNVLVSNGRTSCGGAEEDDQEASNMQNPPRDGIVRECFIPRDGYLYGDCDLDTIELRSLAQVQKDMLGKSTMAEMLHEQYRTNGPDLHVRLAANLVDVDIAEAWSRYQDGDEDFKKYRQMAKPVNFGFPGGLGVEKFIKFAWDSYRVRFSREEAERAKGIWFDTFPEMRDYFALVARMVEDHDAVPQLRSGRMKGGLTFTNLANGYFSGLAADAEKEALWCIAYESYVGKRYDDGKKSVLYGSRTVIFPHDETIMEHPEATASERADRQCQIMIEIAQKWMPDVPITAKPLLTRRWRKGAEPLRVRGQLVPVMPEKIDGKIKWLEDQIKLDSSIAV